jgi:disulfide bond formation protein DsbB
MRQFMRENGLYLAWVVAVVATLGSLYFSEVMKFFPCKLCWYQRILMYPQVILLGLAAVRKDYGQTVYVLPMTILGACISIYHILLQKTDWLKEVGSAGCGPVPCDVQYINWLGFITIPMLALTAFLLITAICFAVRKAARG